MQLNYFPDNIWLEIINNIEKSVISDVKYFYKFSTYYSSESTKYTFLKIFYKYFILSLGNLFHCSKVTRIFLKIS